MEYGSLLLDSLSLAGQSVMHLLFAGRLTGKKPHAWHFALYFSLLCAISLAFAWFSPQGGGALPIGAGVLALYAMVRVALGGKRPVSWLAAVLGFYISQVSFGILNSVEAVLFPYFVGSPLLYLLLLAALALFFLLCTCCYRAAGKLLGQPEGSHTLLLLFPTLFIFAAELYVLRTAYSAIAISLSPEDTGRHGILLSLQGMGLAAMLCTLYAYWHLCQGFQAQAALRSLAQAARFQKKYITEAQIRYEQTKAFRHDIKNHLAVLGGLLRSGNAAGGLAYLEKLEAASSALSFPYQTGNPVVDILLGEKLGLVKGAAAEVSLTLPKPCGIDDFDLCVIFANALDNAAAACRAASGPPSICITGKRQGDFYMLAFENTCPAGPLPPAGTGLASIKAVAEKYHGAVLAEKSGGHFSLHVLLDIS